MLYDWQYVYWLFADNCRLGCLKMQSFLLGFVRCQEGKECSSECYTAFDNVVVIRAFAACGYVFLKAG
jgi:hypothetical protein